MRASGCCRRICGCSTLWLTSRSGTLICAVCHFPGACRGGKAPRSMAHERGATGSGCHRPGTAGAARRRGPGRDHRSDPGSVRRRRSAVDAHQEAVQAPAACAGSWRKGGPTAAPGQEVDAQVLRRLLQMLSREELKASLTACRASIPGDLAGPQGVRYDIGGDLVTRGGVKNHLGGGQVILNSGVLSSGAGGVTITASAVGPGATVSSAPLPRASPATAPAGSPPDGMSG
jgi:hypothetical protein